MKRTVLWSLTIVPLLIVGCSGEDDAQAKIPPTDIPIEIAPTTENQDHIVKLLHEQRLIVIPEVKRKSDEYIQKYRRGEMAREAAAEEFRKWLEAWIEQNPDKIAQLHDRS